MEEPNARINPPHDNCGTDKLMIRDKLIPAGFNELLCCVFPITSENLSKIVALKLGVLTDDSDLGPLVYNVLFYAPNNLSKRL